jgi:predicted DNA-binding transcriptional regulator YafY
MALTKARRTQRMNKADRQFHLIKLLRSRRRVTLEVLREQTGASRATLMRDIAWLRDKLGHPIHWDRDSGNYLLKAEVGDTDSPQELAGLWFNPSEVVALLTLQRLIENVEPGDLLNPILAPLQQRMHGLIAKQGMQQASDQLLKRVRILGIGNRPVRPSCFETVGAALVSRKQLVFDYLARGSGVPSHRCVSPQRLVYYRSNWLLDAWCHERRALRSFSLDSITHPKIQSQTAVDTPEDELNLTLSSGYGIFSGKKVRWATLRFTLERARWVAAEQWHPQQKGKYDRDGRWVLQIPYSDDRELTMDILRHIPEVEVLKPIALRERVLAQMRDGMARWGVS